MDLDSPIGSGAGRQPWKEDSAREAAPRREGEGAADEGDEDDPAEDWEICLLGIPNLVGPACRPLLRDALSAKEVDVEVVVMYAHCEPELP